MMKQLYVADREQWRDWLSQHHATEAGIWLVFYKKETSKPTMAYENAVEEALCFGWIVVAKRPETRERRIAESIALLEKGEKLGLK